jgi:hypothetical protein
MSKFEEGEGFTQRMVENRENLNMKIGVAYVNEMVRLCAFQRIIGENMLDAL